MKQSIKLIILLLVLVGLYGAYLMVTFHQDEPYEFVFSEPKLPPEFIAQQKAEEAEASLSPEERVQKEAAMALMNDAFEKYQGLETSVPKQAASTISVLNTYFYSGDLPPYFLSLSDPVSGQRRFGTLDLSSTTVTLSDAGKKETICTGQTGRNETIIGDTGDNVIECNPSSMDGIQGDLLILSGPGNDKIIDTLGNRVVNAGTGNDTIALGAGRSIIILEDGWGQDQLTIDCAGSSVSSIQVPSDFPVPWDYPYTNFIVLSPSIDREAVYWDGLVLKNKNTDDSLAVNERCFSVIPAGQAASGAALAN